jgi:hypothetical protein
MQDVLANQKSKEYRGDSRNRKAGLGITGSYQRETQQGEGNILN